MSSEDAYDVRPGVPSVEHYRRLRTHAGLSDRSPEGAALGLASTWYGVTAFQGGEPVGMSRVVGDGGCFFQVADICVLPGHQGRGLGRRIMQALTDELELRAPAHSCVSLIADAHHLYRKFGFTDTAPDSICMARFLPAA
ncbi:GNAT family N-acetyltransferase [Streptomyces canus]|uniref:GNAT family N-acetyltransferase n=1 Tax=Streptomyces canus TaxID=58343 RepID=UPI0036E6B50B